MGLLNALRKRRWRARLARYPQVERDHPGALAEAMREAVASLARRLTEPPTGRWFAGGYRLTDLLETRAALGSAEWLFSSPEESDTTRCQEAFPHAVGLPGSFVEKLATVPGGSLQGLLLLWPTTPPLRNLLAVASARLARGGRLGVVSLRDGTPEPSARAMEVALRRATGAAVRSQRTGNPASTGDLRRWMSESSLGDAVCWEEGRNLVFEGAADARLCIEQVAGSRVFPSSLSGHELPRVRAEFEALLAEECRGAGRIVLAYEFICGIAVRVG